MYLERFTRRLRLTAPQAIVPLTIALVGCGAPAEPSTTESAALDAPGLPRLLKSTWSTVDLMSGAALPSGTTTFESVSVAWQVGNYYSGNLQIYGLLCEPTSLPGPHPVAILNHGLYVDSVGQYPGIENQAFQGCTEMAANGWLAAISTYRGEYLDQLPAPFQSDRFNSGGAYQLCLGEVDDVLNLVTAVTALPSANAQQVMMWGHSHGSCITERAIERGVPIQIAVSLDGPTDFTSWDTWLDLTPAGQDVRSSSLNDPAALANVKFLRIQAEADMTVSPTQACELASKLPGSINYHLYSGIVPPGVYYESPSECASYSMPWVYGTPLPDEGVGTWASPTLLLYSGLNHYAVVGHAWGEIRSFVNQFASAGGWHASLPQEFIPFETIPM
jgi:hypothetical protein